MNYTFGRDAPGARLEPYPLVKDYIANAAATASDRGMVRGSTFVGRVGPFTNNSGCGTDIVTLAQIEDVAGTIAIFAGYRSNEVFALCQTSCSDITPPMPSICASTVNNQPWPKYVARRHNDGYNVGYPDGHAKWVRNPRCGEFTRFLGD